MPSHSSSSAPRFSLAQYAISTVAGGGPNNLAALSASIGYPGSIARDAAGNTYIADSYSNHVFKVDTTGNLTVVAGNGTRGYAGDGGPATSAALSNPGGVFVDASGNIFIADTDNCLIREVSGGTISTVAGNTALGCGYSGDGGPATSAQLFDPLGIFVDASGNIFIADTDNCLIRKVSGSTISTVAGNPALPCGYTGDGGPATAAQLDEPFGVFVDGSGNIFIADTGNSAIRVVNPGTAPVTIAGIAIPAGDIQSVAGNGNACVVANPPTPPQCGDTGAATSAQLNGPGAVFVDSVGDIFIADTNDLAIREVAASTTNIITTVVGTIGVAGYSANGTSATSADLNYPSAVIVDSAGDIFIADTFNYVIREVTAGAIQTAMGNNTLAYSGDGGPALNAELNAPGTVAADAAGNIYIADSSNSVIRVLNTGPVAITITGITIQPGDIQTVAGSYYVPSGTALCDYSGDGAAPTSAQLCSPGGVFVDGTGNIFIADTENNRIRVVNTGTQPLTFWGITIPAGDIATVAGNGTLCSGTAAACGDGGAATSAELANPYGVFVDSAENIFIADTYDYVIREVAASSGTITTVAGNYTQCVPANTPTCGDGTTATSAEIDSPFSVFVDPSENIYIADTFNNRIRTVNTSAQPATIAGVTIAAGDIQTVAGTGARGFAGDGAAAASAELDTPYGLFVDSSGDIFIADTENYAIREVVAATGFIQTVAGTPLTAGFSGDGGAATSAELNGPSGVFGTTAGLFVADTENMRIRELVQSIFVTVTPNPVSVAVGASQQFTATVTGSSNTAVNWYVNAVLNGNSTVGTISATGLYQAPATIPTPATVTISATSQADNTTSGSAQATITAAPVVTVTVSTSPAITQVNTGTVQAFIATVTGTTNTAVTWQVNGTTGGNATVGTIDASGNYTAPAAVPTPATVTIEAISVAQSTAIGSETVTIITAPSAADPTPQTSTPGGTATYSLLLNENTGAPGKPITLSCLQSSLPPGGACTFSSSTGAPITTITPGAQAVAFSLTISIPTGSAALAYPNSESPSNLRLATYGSFLPLAGIFFVGAGRFKVSRTKKQNWLALAGLCAFLMLMMLSACGGVGGGSTQKNPELGTYNVKVQGATTAQPNPVTITVAGLTVQ